MPKKTRSCVGCGKYPSVPKSHIIPNSYYKEVKEEDGKIYMLDFELKDAGSPKQSGHWEPLLCTNCESEFNTKYDDPAYRFSQSLPKELQLVDGRLPSEIAVDFPQSFRHFILSVLFRAANAQHESWRICSDLWDATRLRKVLQGTMLDTIQVFPRALAFSDGTVHQGYVVPPQRLTIPGDNASFTCMAFGGMEYIARMHRGKMQPDTPEIPKSGGLIPVLVGDIFQSWALHELNNHNRKSI